MMASAESWGIRVRPSRLSMITSYLSDDWWAPVIGRHERATPTLWNWYSLLNQWRVIYSDNAWELIEVQLQHFNMQPVHSSESISWCSFYDIPTSDDMFDSLVAEWHHHHDNSMLHFFFFFKLTTPSEMLTASYWMCGCWFSKVDKSGLSLHHWLH